MKIKETIKKYQNSGLEYVDALAKTCQDIMLSKIAKSNFGEHIAV